MEEKDNLPQGEFAEDPDLRGGGGESSAEVSSAAKTGSLNESDVSTSVDCATAPQPQPQPQPQTAEQRNFPKVSLSKKWYEKTWLMVLAALIIPPLTIALTWVVKKPKSIALRITTTVLLALYSLFLLLCTIAVATVPPTTYVTAEYNGVQFSVPDTWEKDSDESTPSYVDAADDGMSHAVLSLAYLEYEEGYDDNASALLQQTLDAYTADYSVTSTETNKVGDQDSLTASYSLTNSQDVALNGIVRFVAVANGVVSVTVTYPASSSFLYSNVADTVIGSLALTDDEVMAIEKAVEEREIARNTIVSISASYDGSTEAGTTIDSGNTDVVVTAACQDGTTRTLDNWTVSEPITLEADKTSTVTIQYEGISCTLDVACSTVSPEGYKSQCTEVSYDELMRNPEDYIDKQVMVTGEVMQVINGYNSSYLIEITPMGYGYYSDPIYVSLASDAVIDNLIEDDVVSVYGIGKGTYSYETALGVIKTVPAIQAQYIDLK